MRLFVTHKVDEEKDLWTMVVEGKLLIGLLDHASAQRVDKHGAYAREKGKNGEAVQEMKPSSILPTVPEPGAAEGNEGPATTRADRNKYRRCVELGGPQYNNFFFVH